MKLSTQAEIEIAGEITIRDIQIGINKYILEITQGGCSGDCLVLTFRDQKTDGIYHIHIDSRGLRLSRDVMRPNHDHWDDEDIRIIKGKPVFFHGHVNDELKHELAWFEFGARVVEW